MKKVLLFLIGLALAGSGSAQSRVGASYGRTYLPLYETTGGAFRLHYTHVTPKGWLLSAGAGVLSSVSIQEAGFVVGQVERTRFFRSWSLQADVGKRVWANDRWNLEVKAGPRFLNYSRYVPIQTFDEGVLIEPGSPARPTPGVYLLEYTIVSGRQVGGGAGLTLNRTAKNFTFGLEAEVAAFRSFVLPCLNLSVSHTIR